MPAAPSPTTRLLRRLALALGVGGLLYLLRKLYERLSTPQLTHGGIQRRPSTRGKELWEHLGATTLRRGSSTLQKPYAAFISHMKAETSMESRFLQTELERKLERRCFLDSDDLRDLSDLEQHVRDSDVLILVQSQSVLTRPYCILEILTAMEAGVPIVGVALCKHAFPYCFEGASALLEALDSALAVASPGADVFLTDRGICLKEAAYKCSSRIPKIISVHLDTCASRNILAATIDDLAAAMASAKPVPLEGTKEGWLAARAQRRDAKKQELPAAAHGRPFEPKPAPFERKPSATSKNAASVAAVVSALKQGIEPAAPAPTPTGAAVATGLWISKSRKTRPRLALPNPTVVLREPSDLPAEWLGDDSVITLINGGHSIGPDGPIEACCAFSQPVIVLLHNLAPGRVHEFTIDLLAKAETKAWLKAIVHAGKEGEEYAKAKLSTPSVHYKGVWYTDSADVIAALPSLFPETAATLCRPPSHLDPANLGSLGTMKPMMPLLASSWEDAGEHPGLELWAPFEEALGKAPFFGGDAFSDVDLRVAPWVHSYMAFDATFGDESHPPLDWEADLPNICRWLDGGGMMRMIRRASVTERRYQLLLAYILPKEINPALGERVPAEILEEIEMTSALATKMKTGTFTM